MSPIRKEIIALLVFIMIVLAINPKIVTQMDQTILGRVVLVAIMICLAANNATVGILCVFVVIVLLNTYGDVTRIEGMHDISSKENQDAVHTNTNAQNVKSKKSGFQNNTTENLALLDTMVASVQSNSLPSSSNINKSSSEVKASSDTRLANNNLSGSKF